MGGGTGYNGRSLGDTKELEKKAKEELSRGQRSNTFLSFNTDDMDEVNLLRGQAKNDKSEIEFIDRSVRQPYNSEKADYIKKKISERINSASQTVVYLSNETHKSNWVKWEVEKSIELGKKVVAVYKGENRPGNIPSYILNNNIKIVKWKDLSDHI